MKLPPILRLLPRLLLLAAALLTTACQPKPVGDANYVSYRADPRRQTIRLYWHDGQGQRYGSLGKLRDAAAALGDSLVFAANGGMFNAAFGPQGLFIQDGHQAVPLDTAAGEGNFYLRPNGVFYLTKVGRAGICPTAAFPSVAQVRYATQSGPMLVINGLVHPKFRVGSANVQVRNGVGILPDGQVLLAMSKAKVNLYDFADYFRRAGCRNALYLDGFVSRTYAPAANWKQTDGDFGVIIGITAPKQQLPPPSLPAN